MTEQRNSGTANEMPIKEVIINLQFFVKYIITKRVLIAIFGLAGAVIGIAYALYKKPVYTASCSFVVVESKGGALSQYANLASLVGIDLDGGGGGIFQGDNIIALYTSRTMIVKTLLDTAVFSGKKQLLVDRYVDYMKLRDKWAKKGISNVRFDGRFENFNRLQDSLLIDMVTSINKKILSVSKPDKKQSIINVDVKFEDELFAKSFSEKLVATVNDYYIRSKTQKASANVDMLKKQVDSVRHILNSSIGGVASALDAAPNANPALLSLRVPSQRKQVDVQASSAVYAEMVKNLEIAKIGLMQDKPLIQLIDTPILPLEVKKVSKITAALIGYVLGCAVLIGWLGVKSLYNKIMN